MDYVVLERRDLIVLVPLAVTIRIYYFCKRIDIFTCAISKYITIIIIKIVVEFFFDVIVITLVGASSKGKASKDIFGLAAHSLK